MPFGLCCVSAMFERLIKIVLARRQWDYSIVVRGEIIVVSKINENMVVDLQDFF